ncbi:MAG: hypothetical protein ACI4TF_16085 [Oliverpabstia sp.]
MKKKRVVSMLLALSMTAGLAACGSSEKEDAQTSAETTAEENAESVETDENVYGYDNPITLNVGVAYNSDFDWAPGESAEDNAWWNLYKEEGYDLKLMYNVDGTQEENKRTTAIASGTYPDIMYVRGADLVKYAQTGVIASIDEAFETYATDELKEYIAVGGEGALDSAKVDGKLYGIPQVYDNHSAAMMMFIRQDWLDNLGMEIPTTMDELKEVALAFTANDPDGNGQNDTYGLALNGKDGFTYWSGLQAFFEGYGAAPGHWSGQFTFIEKDGEIVWGGALSDEMKAGLTDLQEMYQNGSLAKNFGTMDYNQLLEDIGSGKCGIWFAPNWGAMVPAIDAMKSDINAHIVTAKVPDGMGEGSSKPFIPTNPNGYYVISSKCANPEAIVKMANLSVQKFCYPESAEEYEKYNGKTGVYSGWKTSLVQLTSPTESIESVSDIYQAVTNNQLDELSSARRVTADSIVAYTSAAEDGTLADKLAESDADVQTGISNYTVYGDPLGGGLTMLKLIEEGNFNYLAYNYVPTDTMASAYSTLDSMTLETLVKIITGESVDSYDDFLASWEALGGADATKEAQEWYDQNQ